MENEDSIFIGGDMFRRIPFGKDHAEHATDGTCPDCGCFEGDVHRRGCRGEMCPNCMTDLVVCGCHATFSGPTEETVSSGGDDHGVEE